MLLMKTPSSVACRCILNLSPRMAPPEKGDEGSTARIPTLRPLLLHTGIIASTMVLLPAPALPVMPMV